MDIYHAIFLCSNLYPFIVKQGYPARIYDQHSIILFALIMIANQGTSQSSPYSFYSL